MSKTACVKIYDSRNRHIIIQWFQREIPTSLYLFYSKWPLRMEEGGGGVIRPKRVFFDGLISLSH